MQENTLPILKQDLTTVDNRTSSVLKMYPHQKDFVVAMNHTSLEKKYAKIRTVGDAFDTEYIKMNELKVIYTEETPRMLIETWLIQLTLFFDLPLNKDQVRELAWLIYDDMHFLNLAEMTLLFTRIKKGYYGKFFGRIDPSEILSWCREYRKERGMYISKLP
jgi:hypothetical protein